MGEPRNVVITSAGRRTFLVEAFKAALEPSGLVIAADIDPLAPALFLADRAIELPRLDADDYADRLVALIVEADVRAVIPTIDTELPLLAKLSDRLFSCGAVAVVSTPSFVAATMDKWLSIEAFGKEGVRVPQTWRPDDLRDANLPERLIVKPRFGSASQGVLRVSRQHLAHAIALTDRPIVQEELGGSEVTVDAFFDMTGRLIHYVPRLRLKAIGGESVEGITISRDELGPWIDHALTASGRLGARGPVTLQCFLESSGPILTEVNARFGGGFPLTFRAGGRYPEWLLQGLNGSTLEPRIGQYEVGLAMTRHYVEIFPKKAFW